MSCEDEQHISGSTFIAAKYPAYRQTSLKKGRSAGIGNLV